MMHAETERQLVCLQLALGDVLDEGHGLPFCQLPLRSRMFGKV
jgi:hypothetical protein